MTALPKDVVADLGRRVAELEQRLQSGLAERDEAIAQQAAIAAENVRLLTELRTARDRQAGSAEILRAIADASGDAERSLQQIAETTARLFGASSVTLNIASGDEWARMIRVGPSSQRVGSELSAAQLGIGGRNLPATVFRENRQIHIPDLDNLDPAFADWPTVPHARAAGARALAGTPLRREGKAIGALVVHRDRPVPFTDEELVLLQSFADQAVIAIENARLFNETREALERQTATAEILKVIASSPSDVQPVFDVIVERAVRLCGGRMGRVYRYDGEIIQMVAAHGLSVPGLSKVQQVFPRPATDDTIAGQVMQSHRPYFVTDIKSDESVPALSRQMIEAMGTRSQVTVPMLRSGEPIGAITVGWADPGAYKDQQVRLLQTFADQAVIAIENVRLFNETREALERQTATADILKVIASSPSDVQPVFEAIAASANRLIGGHSTAVSRFVDGAVHLAAFTPTSPAADEVLKASLPRPLANFPPFEWLRKGEAVQLADAETVPDVRDIARARGYRSVLFAPLMSNGAPIGMIGVTRVEPGSFAAHHVQLLQTFADQAVIAIENVRMFDEVQARTEDLRESLQQQTATADVLKVISRSAFDLQTVLDTLTESAARLCNADMAAIARKDAGGFYHATNYNFSVDWVRFTDPVRIQPGRGSVIGRALLGGAAVQIPDVLADPEYAHSDMQKAAGYRTILGVPLLRGKEPIGVLFLGRKTVEPFTEKQVELVSTFADQAVIAIENVRLFDEVQAKTRELEEALTYQTGSSNILGVIASSPTDVGPVLKAIVESACELCEAYDAVVLLKDGDDLRFNAHHGPIPIGLEKWPINRRWVTGRSVIDRAPVHVHDLLSEVAEFPEGQEMSRRQGHRSILSVPLLREGESLGAIVLRRTEVQPFSDKQVALLQTFADQAVIAIGNVHLFEEVQARTEDLRESLQQQTATADVLKVISRSAFDLQKVLDTLSDSAARLCEADIVVIHRSFGDNFQRVASFGLPEEERRTVLQIDHKPGRGSLGARVLLEKAPVLIDDAESDPEYTFHSFQRRAGIRSMLGVPLMRENVAIGLLLISRKQVRPFTKRHVDLATTFADQAVIAIENVRLFDEVQAKTRELSEALTYQTGSSNILGVIASSPTDVGPVLKAIVESACELCEADDALVVLKDGDDLVFKAQHGSIPVVWQRQPINRQWTAGRAVLDRKAVHVHDLLAPEGEEFPEAREFARRTNVRTVLSVPLLRENQSIGSIVLRRTDVQPFSDKQIALLQTFADQAVIALGNVRLFDEVQAKTRDLTEALTYQTGSGNILRVIASSPTDVGPVLNAIVESASELCEAYDSVVLLKDGDDLRFSAHHGPIPINIEKWPISRNWTAGRAYVDKGPVHIHDLVSDEGADFPDGRELSRYTGSQGIRTILSVPLLREKESIGAILLRRTEVQPFSEKQIALLQTFADQAVIAIGNVRLFDEVQAKTRDLTESLQQQTATADVLKVISASPGELDPVFQAMLENAVRLCEAKFAMLFLLEGDQFRAVAIWNLPPAYSEFLGKNPIRVDSKIPLGQVASTKQPVQVADVQLHEAYLEGYPGMVAVAELGGARTLLQVPMLKEDNLVGTIGIYRQEMRPFTDKQVSLVQNFAAQAVIAIENARLLNELRQRTEDLSRSLNDLRTAQDRLVQTQKLASLGQLTAGIAHEIKNPLNFINNFSALSAELTDELNEVLKSVTLSDKIRGEVDELTRVLKGNLEKVVQHGKRADSIVKNMLLHSREGSGEHRPTDINALLDESLNLAYHGARAEKREFNVTLQRDFDEMAGAVDLFPQEITRAFLNLISNGFYAANKRKREIGSGFEPVLQATTRDLGDSVEIRIRDNGTGIPIEVKEKMFNPFFTTKPAGEGTGLGLSMSHDIIVKQHGGTIDVDTAPGEYTEFRIVLPRTSNIASKVRDQT